MEGQGGQDGRELPACFLRRHPVYFPSQEADQVITQLLFCEAQRGYRARTVRYCSRWGERGATEFLPASLVYPVARSGRPAMWSSPSKKAYTVGRICYTKSDGAVRVYDLTRNITVGRSAECDIRVKQATVSRVHCNIIRVHPAPPTVEGAAAVGADESPFVGDYYLENLSQTNLTEINYIAKWGRTQLKDGDIITIGERDFVFRLVKVQMTQEEIIASQAPNTPKGKISLDDVDATPTPYPATGLGDNLCNPLWPGAAATAAAAGDAPRALSKSPAPVKATSAADQSLWNCIPASIIPLGGGGGPDQTDAVDVPAGDGATKFSAAGRVRFVNSVKAGDTSAKKKKAEGARREVKEIAQKVEEGTLDPNMKARNSEKSWLTGLFFSV